MASIPLFGRARLHATVPLSTMHVSLFLFPKLSTLNCLPSSSRRTPAGGAYWTMGRLLTYLSSLSPLCTAFAPTWSGCLNRP